MKTFFTRTLSVIGLISFAGFAVADVPTVKSMSPSGVERGKAVEVELVGEELNDIEQIVFYSPGLTAKDLKVIDRRKAKVTIVADEKAECDLHAFRVVTKFGLSNLRLFGVSPLPNIDEQEKSNNSLDEPQLISLNSTINGIVQSEDVDYFAVEVPQGELISVELEGLRHNYLNNMFDPYVAIYDAQGNMLTENDDAALVQQDCICGIVAPTSGRYIIEVRDASYGGSSAAVYRAHIGNFARPIAIYPSGGRPGENLKATCVDAAGNTWEENFQLPNEPNPRFKVWSTRGKVSPPSPNFLRVFAYDGVMEQEPNNDAKDYKALPVVESFPVALNGCLQSPGDQDWFVFAAKKDQQLEFRLIARSIIRSPLDGVIEIHKFDGGRLNLSDDSGGGPDAALSFKAPADGKYAVCIREHLNKGGPHFTYRLEIDPPAPKLTTTIKEQERYMSQTIPVHRGTRMAVDVLLDRKFVGGVTEIVIPDLPPGMEQVRAVVAENSNHAQLMLRAKADASNTGKLVDLSARLKKDGDKSELIGHMDQRTQIVRGQNNRDVWGINSDKLAVAVLDPIDFDIEVVQPKVPLVRDGTLPLIVKAKRKPGFTRAIRVKVLDTPSGVTASTSISIPEGQDQVELPLTANGKAAIGKWPITVLATSKVGDNNTVTIASEFIEVEVAEKLFEFEFAKTMAEVGKPAKVAIGVGLNREVEGTIEVEVVGLPPGTTMEKTKLPLAKDAKRLTYVLSIPPTSRPGVFKTIAARGTVTSDKGVITQVNGTGEVQIDTPRNAPAKAAGKDVDEDKPLSRLEELRKQREETQK